MWDLWFHSDKKKKEFFSHYAVAFMVIDKKLFKVFPRFMSMRAIDSQGHDQFVPKGLNWQDLCLGPLDIATY